MRETLVDGRFRVEQKLAEGASGKVYRAIDLESGAPVALKILHPQSARSSDLVARFSRECRLLADLDHANAVCIYGAGLTQEQLPYVAMELVQGRTLSQIVAEEGPIDPRRMCDYLFQIADVLEAAHARQILHRDLKPGNIMLGTGAAGTETVKVLDFGMAKLLGTDQFNATVVTQAGTTVGTPEYMSPEQAMGRALGPATDVYALGVTLYAVLTGAVPFQGSNYLQTMLAHVQEPIPRFSAKNSKNTVPLSVEGIVRHAMAKEPADRPASPGELARLFADAVDHPDRVPAELRELERPKRPAEPIARATPTTVAAAEGPSPIALTLTILGGALAAGILIGLLR